MNILSILASNLRRGSRTLRPADLVPPPAGYRGSLAHEAGLCVGCRSCAYVCSPGAITFREPADPGRSARGLAIAWRYFAGQCTFCGRCVEYCPTQALSLEPGALPVSGDPAAHRIEHAVVYRPCRRCGSPVVPLPSATLAMLYGDPLPPEIAATRDLCERCRALSSAERLKNALLGRRDEGISNSNGHAHVY